MKALLPWVVLVAYLLTWLEWVPDEQGPILLYLPILAGANFEDIVRGGPIIPSAIIAIVCGIAGCVSVALFASRIWRSKWGALTACTALMISEVAFVIGTYPRAFTAALAVPFLVLSFILLRREFAGQNAVA